MTPPSLRFKVRDLKSLNKIVSALLYDTFGAIAISLLLICALSGIFLAIPYDVSSPMQSISNLMLTNPGASLFRNIHYWSAQLFLIFTIIHLWEHYYKKTEKKTKKGVWLRLIISLPVLFYVMLSGFILKGDTESLQAREIMDSLLSGIPWIGSVISYTLLGPEDSFQVIYMHHLATATIFLFIITWEHARMIWGKIRTLVITSFVVLLLSFWFQAPLHDLFDPVVKGPWYFLGLQEILYWMSQPEYILLIILALLLANYLVRGLTARRAEFLKWSLFIIFIFYLGLTATGYFFRGENWQWTWKAEHIHKPIDPELINFSAFTTNNSFSDKMPFGRDESCLICHDGMQGLSPSHSPEAIGCVSCHGGNPFRPDKEQAHKNMRLIPGNLADAKQSCGTANCHPEITDRIQNTLMTTLSGMVSVDRYVFGEIDSPSQLSRITEIGHSAADEHLRDLCASCHLGNPKTEPGPIDQLSRGGGCNACHLNYSDEARKEVNDLFAQPRPDSKTFKFHPSLSLDISNDHCFGCHSRSGRISTNYEGWHETRLEKNEVEHPEEYRILQDDRVFRFVEADIHHQKGMDCIDCHNSYELMGDGNLYTHKEQQVKIQCEDCHFHEKPPTMQLKDFDQQSAKIMQVREIEDESREFLSINASGYPLTNTYLDQANKAWLITKNGNDTLPLLSPASICTRGNAHESLTCRSCHTSWAPQCIGCHNEYDKNIQGFDLLANRFKEGEWVEFIGEYYADPPVLGIGYDTSGAEKKRIVETFVAGMIMTIDKTSYPGSENQEMIFHRLFAPSAAHTIQLKGRDCKSCHNSSNAIGYGRGELIYDMDDGKGSWKFKARFVKNKHDGLPEDAWIPFLGERYEDVATRLDKRPFSLEEQKNILTVGACLTCHTDNSEVMMRSLQHFDKVLKEVSSQCILPVWE